MKNPLTCVHCRPWAWLAGLALVCATCQGAAAESYTITDLGPYGALRSESMSVSSQVATGWAYTPSGYGNAVLSENGTTTLLGTLGGNSSAGEAVNNSGQVTGWADTSDGIYQAFLYSNGIMTDIGTLGGSYSNGMAINSLGAVTGWAHNSSGYYNAFLYSNGAMTDLGTLGGTSSIGYAINDAGQVTGWAYTADGYDHAFLYSGGQMIDLNTAVSPTSGWTLLDATNINNAGQITGFGTYNGQSEAYLLTPTADSPAAAVPLPNAGYAAFTLLGLFGGWNIVRRRTTANA